MASGATGITKWERPYVNLDINGDNDSTDESVYGGNEGNRESSDDGAINRQRHVPVDHGVWIEKYSTKYDMKYWKNKDTKLLSWSKPPLSGISLSKQRTFGRRTKGLLKKVPVSSISI